MGGCLLLLGALLLPWAAGAAALEAFGWQLGFVAWSCGMVVAIATCRSLMRYGIDKSGQGGSYDDDPGD